MTERKTILCRPDDPRLARVVPDPERMAWDEGHPDGPVFVAIGTKSNPERARALCEQHGIALPDGWLTGGHDHD